VLSKACSCLFFFNLLRNALKIDIFSGNSINTSDVRIFSNRVFPVSMFPVLFITEATIASFIVEGLGAGAERA